MIIGTEKKQNKIMKLCIKLGERMKMRKSQQAKIIKNIK